MILKSLFGIMLVIGISSCEFFKGEPEAIWEPDIYYGLPDIGGIAKEENYGKRIIQCTSPEFGEYICLAKDEAARMFALCMPSE